MESIRQESPQRSNLAWVMRAWSEVFGTEQRTARDAIADASVTTHDGELVHKNLHDAFMEVAGGRSGINGYRLGCWLRANKGKVSDGRHFEEAGEFREGARWVLPNENNKTLCGLRGHRGHASKLPMRFGRYWHGIFVHYAFCQNCSCKPRHLREVREVRKSRALAKQRRLQ
jgi:hypothetical protein